MRYRQSVGVSVFAILLLASAAANAFDENRKGIVVGVGVGSGLTTFTQDLELTLQGFGPILEKQTSDRESKPIVSTDFKLGWGLSDQLLVYYLVKVSWFRHSDVFVYDNVNTPWKEFYWALDGFEPCDTLIAGCPPAKKDVWIAHGFGGLGLTYYFSAQPSSFYVLGALGFSTWSAPFEDDDWLEPIISHSRTWFGLGVIAGIGYEFSRHWSVEATALWGNPGEKGSLEVFPGTNVELEVNSSPLSLLITVNGLAY